MKLLDVVKQLHSVLPQYTSLFSDVLNVGSIVASGGVATIVTATNHGVKSSPNASLTLANVNSETPIGSVSKDGNTVTFGASADHDLTFGWKDHDTVSLDGFTDSAWNDSFKLLRVPNRRTFVVQSTEALPVLNGNEFLLENKIGGINGRYQPTFVDIKTLTITGAFSDGNYEGGTVGSGVRVGGMINPDDISEYYTSQNLNDFWMFVSMHDAELSKDRHSLSDAEATRATGDDIRMRLLDGFTISIVKNVTKDISAIDAIDVCRDELQLPILKSVFGAKFDTGLSSSADFKAVLTGHGVALYNRAIIIYNYDFEFAMDLTNDDTVEPENTHAFRDIDLTEVINGDDTIDMTVTVDLDDEPLN